MKGQQSDSEEQVRDNPTKQKINLPKKLKASEFDELRTKKSRVDSFSQMCERILQEKMKLRQQFVLQGQQNKERGQQRDVMVYDPQFKNGKIQNYKQLSQKQKVQLGLGEQGKCQQFTLNDQYLIVIIGRLPIPYSNGTYVSLYLPRSMIEGPQTQIQNRQLVIIQRRSIQNDSNFLNYPYVMVQPQIMLYPSYLCSWIDCKRRVSLVNYISSQYEVNQHLVFGSACHRYMEWLLDKQVQVDNKNYKEWRDIIQKIYKSFLYDMYLIRASFDDFWKYCEQSLNNIRIWVKNHIFMKKEIEINKYQKSYLVIDEVIGSETMHRSKYFGMKGKTDGLFKGRLINKGANKVTEVFVPFQLKTGKKCSQSHKRQTDIYNMLLRQKYKQPILGLLYYSQGNFSVFRNESSQIAFQTLIIHRNTILLNLANLYKTQKISLPVMTTNMDSCKSCQVSTQCQVLHIEDKLLETGSNKYKKKYMATIDSDSQAESKVPSDQNATAKKNIQSLSPSQVSYLCRWMRWLHYQERETKLSIQKNQKLGFDSFTLKSEQLGRIMTYFKSNLQIKLRITIEKNMKSLQQLNQISSYYQPSQKMRIIIQHLGIMEGCKVIRVKKRNNVFFMKVQMNSKEVALDKKALLYSTQNNVCHDVDLQRFENQAATILRNCIFKFVIGTNQRLKQMVLQNYTKKALPQPDLPPTVQQPQMNQDNSKREQEKKEEVSIEPSDLIDLNIDQIQALKKVFSQEYCTLVQGMPGTGKTQLIIKLIQKCNRLNWKVLITTFTNSSLDNILSRTIKRHIVETDSIIREGSRYSITQKFEKLNSRSRKFQTIEDYEQYFANKKFWFVTLASMNIHHIPKTFDLVILDEASQSLEPACIEALSRGTKIVMIGDYKQLRPIVKSNKADSEGMSTSLFQRLCMRFPHKTTSLKLQYRMNEQIMNISNTLVYDDQLKVGKQEVGDKKLLIKENWKQLCGQQTLMRTIDPQNSVIFLNHDGITSSLNQKYRQHKDQIAHILQVQISAYLFKKLAQLGVSTQQMTLVCVYNRTVDVISRLLKKKSFNGLSKDQKKSKGQVLTIDKSQGIDKQLIILLAQSRTSTNNILLEDCRRLNVALTRAKSKLIIIGSMKYLSEMNVWEGKLSKLLQNNTYAITKSLIDHILAQFKQVKQTDQSSIYQSEHQQIQ